jgi:uncharacterized protein Yka (UPF0111/DUF47 family)
MSIVNDINTYLNRLSDDLSENRNASYNIRQLRDALVKLVKKVEDLENRIDDLESQ